MQAEHGGGLLALRSRVGRVFLGVLAISIVLSACGSQPVGQASAPQTGAAPVTKLTAAYSEITFLNLPVWIAKEQGIFDKNRLDVELQNIASSNAIAALLAGQV